jgi:hypothetical protein
MKGLMALFLMFSLSSCQEKKAGEKKQPSLQSEVTTKKVVTEGTDEIILEECDSKKKDQIVEAEKKTFDDLDLSKSDTGCSIE